VRDADASEVNEHPLLSERHRLHQLRAVQGDGGRGEFVTMTLNGSEERRIAGSDNYDVDVVCQNSSGASQLNVGAVALQAFSLR
jgi:hypothetical protein